MCWNVTRCWVVKIGRKSGAPICELGEATGLVIETLEHS